jgi:hypothetical protein
MAIASRDVAPSEWQKRRLQRIARQEAKRKARKEALENARQEAAAEAEEDDTEDERPRKKGKKMKRTPARSAQRTFLFLPIPSMPEMNGNRWTAVIIWLIGAYLTRAFLIQIGVAEDVASPIGLLLQWLLTKAESPLWRGQSRPWIAVIATVIDTGFNAGGTWVYTKNIGKTDFWAMVQYATEDPKLAPAIATQIALAIAVGLLTAAAAEYFWNLSDT